MRLTVFVFLLGIVFLQTCKKNHTILYPPENPPVNNQPDTTSHNFTFVIDTIGNNPLFPSHLWDVWVVNENDVWVVGEINTLDTGFDSSGHFTPPYGAAHWNGEKWEYKRFYWNHGGENTSHSGFYGIWYFSPKNIWLATNWVFHCTDGVNLKLEYKSDISKQEGIRKLWAASENEIYGVGTRGLIVKYDGNSWTRMESGTDVDLLNVWGVKDKQTGQTHVFAAGSRGDRDYGVVLELKNGQWLHRFDAQHPIFGKEDDHTHPDAIWVYNDSVYTTFAGYDNSYVVRHAFVAYENEFSITHKESQGAIMNINGNALNDFFLVGYRDVVLHYNGRTFKKYFQFPFIDAKYYSVKQKGDYVFACGIIFASTKAIVLRGKRNK